MFETMVKKQEEIENLKKFIKSMGINDKKLNDICDGKIKEVKKKDVDRCIVTLEIIIDKDIAKKYPNFIFNYESKKDFLNNQISSLEHNTHIDECLVFINNHPAFGNPDYDYKFYDDGYKQIVKKVEFL